MSTTTPLAVAPLAGDRIDNAPLRAAFEASGMTASLVAHRLDWTFSRDGRTCADGSRVKRALGIMERRGSGAGSSARPHRATSIHIDIAARIADVIGADPRDVGC